jgi:hypothetical protein
MSAIQMRPSAQQVAIAWLQTIPELNAADIASTLAPIAQWTGQDFVVAGVGLGGIPRMGMATRVPVIQIDCWAKAPNSNRPAWNRASMTAEAIRDATYGQGQSNANLVLPGGFMAVYLSSVMLMSEPRRVQSDAAAIARYTLDAQLTYVPVGLVIV